MSTNQNVTLSLTAVAALSYSADAFPLIAILWWWCSRSGQVRISDRGDKSESWWSLWIGQRRLLSQVHSLQDNFQGEPNYKNESDQAHSRQTSDQAGGASPRLATTSILWSASSSTNSWSQCSISVWGGTFGVSFFLMISHLLWSIVKVLSSTRALEYSTIILFDWFKVIECSISNVRPEYLNQIFDLPSPIYELMVL